MFSKVALFVTSAFALAAVAAPYDPSNTGNGSSGNQCNVGSVQCCNSVQNSDSSAVQGLAGLLGIALSTLTAQVGINCTPISAVVGLGGNSCSAQPTCCTGNSFNGLIVLGCTPINANL